MPRWHVALRVMVYQRDGSKLRRRARQSRRAQTWPPPSFFAAQATFALSLFLVSNLFKVCRTLRQTVRRRREPSQYLKSTNDSVLRRFSKLHVRVASECVADYENQIRRFNASS